VRRDIIISNVVEKTDAFNQLRRGLQNQDCHSESNKGWWVRFMGTAMGG